MVKVTIDVAGMGRVVRGIESGIETIADGQSALRGTLNRFDVSSARVWAISRAVTWAQDELPGLRRRLAMAEALEGSRPEWPLGVVEFDEVEISTMSPEAAQRAGEEAALALRDGRGKPDPDLVQQILDNADDPYFAAGFAKAVDAEELAAVVVRLQYARTPSGQLTPEEVTAANQWYADLLAGMSQTLATATRSTGDLALPADYAQSWVDEITAEVPTQYPYEGDGVVDHANALGLLLSQGRFGTDFLGTVAAGVYDYEREFGAEHGKVWAPRSSDSSTGYSVHTADGMRFADPLAGIMAALGNNPEAAQEFFSGGNRVTVEIAGSDVEVSDRLHYLLVERTWVTDPANGETLGSALEAATTTFRDRTAQGRVSAEIAAQTFALIGEQTGEGADPGILGGFVFGIGADDGWELWDGMRPALARMLASYGADVHRAVVIDADDLGDGWTVTGSGTLFPADMPYGAAMDKELVAKLVATLGEDQEAFTLFLTGVMQANNLAVSTGLQRALESGGDQAVADFLRGIKRDDSSPAVTNASTVLGWALDTGFGGDAADEAMQKKQMEAVADALSFATALPFVPEIKPAWLKWGADQVEDRVVDAVKGSAPSDAASTYEALDDRAQIDLRDGTMNLLLQNGYFDVAVEGVRRPPEAVIVRGPSGEPLYFDTDAKAYLDWLGSSSLQSVLAESVVGVYADQWSRTR